MIAGLVALTLAGFFTGAAFYVSFAEQPARLALEDGPALAQWKPAYKRGARMQAALALAAGVAGLAAWWQTGQMLFAAGAVFQLAPWPWTLLVILPTNRALLATPADKAGARSRVLMETWGRLHLVRVGLGAAATGLYFGACLQDISLTV